MRRAWLVGLAAVLLSVGIAGADPVAIEVATAEASLQPRTGEPVVTLRLSETSARVLAQITQENVGRVLELRIDGKVVMSPMIREPILAGLLQISGKLTFKEARDIAGSIRSGSKVEVELVR